MSQWPYPAGVIPQPDNVDHELRPDPDEIVSATPRCKHCNSTSLRNNGSYTSVRWNETRQQYFCRDCRGTGSLPLGQWLPRDEMALPHGRTGPRKSRPVQQEEIILADDRRPACPFCNGTEINRRGILPCGTQRWFCRVCQKRFVSAAHRHATLDRRKVQHWDEIDPREEATFLFRYAVRHGNVANVREDIGISDHEKNDLEFLVADGVLPRAEVDEAIRFRVQVLQVFDELMHKQQRCLETLASMGLLTQSNTEDMLKFRDRMMEKFDGGLVDAELLVLACPPDVKEKTGHALEAFDELITQKDDC